MLPSLLMHSSMFVAPKVFLGRQGLLTCSCFAAHMPAAHTLLRHSQPAGLVRLLNARCNSGPITGFLDISRLPDGCFWQSSQGLCIIDEKMIFCWIRDIQAWQICAVSHPLDGFVVAKQSRAVHC